MDILGISRENGTEGHKVVEGLGNTRWCLVATVSILRFKPMAALTTARESAKSCAADSGQQHVSGSVETVGV